MSDDYDCPVCRLPGSDHEDVHKENERLTKANEAWHQRMSFVKTDTEALTAENERLVKWLQHLRSDACDDGSHFSGSLKLCDIDLCCDLALSGDPAPTLEATEHLTAYQHVLRLLAQVTALEKERDFWNEQHSETCLSLKTQVTVLEHELEHEKGLGSDRVGHILSLNKQLAAMTKERDDLQDDLAALNAKYWEDHQYTDIKKIDELQARIKELEETR